jgi:acyl dehydratase
VLVVGASADVAGTGGSSGARRRRAAGRWHADRHRPVVLTAGCAARYADAAGDPNPIHRDPAAARDAGYPAVVVPGLYLLARATAVVAGERPVAQVASRFTGAAAPGDVLDLASGPIDEATMGFRLDGPAGAVVKAGRLTVAPPLRAIGGDERA